MGMVLFGGLGGGFDHVEAEESALYVEAAYGSGAYTAVGFR